MVVEETGHPAAEVARYPHLPTPGIGGQVGISRVGVKKAVGRGMQLKKQGLFDE